MFAQDHLAAAAALSDAARLRQPIAPISECWAGATVADAYAIQRLGLQKRLAGGSQLRGHKIGLTSRSMQRMLGVDEPDFGYLLDDMFIKNGATVSIAEFIAPKIEPEIAFVLERPLTGPGVTAADVVQATAYVCPALELIDSRIEKWRIKIVDTIADNASSARAVLGTTRRALDDADLRFAPAVLSKNGVVMETGAGAAVLDNPINAVAWLANALGAYGVTLEAGQVILPGSCTAAIAVTAGDHVLAEFGALGSVSVAFA